MSEGKQLKRKPVFHQAASERLPPPPLSLLLSPPSPLPPSVGGVTHLLYLSVHLHLASTRCQLRGRRKEESTDARINTLLQSLKLN